MKIVMKFLRKKLASPAVAAICDSLEEDHDTWENEGVLIAHKSKRFAVILPDVGHRISIMNHLGEDAVALDKFEQFALSCSVESWLDEENFNEYVRSLLTDAQRLGV